MSAPGVEVLEPSVDGGLGLRLQVGVLEGRLAQLVRAGAGLFDPPAVRFVEALLQRAVELPEVAGQRLVRRARERLEALEEARAKARESAAKALAELSGASPARHVDVSQAFEAGDYDWARRDAQRALREARRGRSQPDASWLQRVAERARTRTVSLPEEVARGLVHLEDAGSDLATRSRAQAVGGALSLALFREAAGAARAQLLVARALDALPEQVGAYNPQLIAAKALAALALLSPSYLRVYLSRLEDLSRLEIAFAPVPAAAPPAEAGPGAKGPKKAPTKPAPKAPRTARKVGSKTSKATKKVKTVKTVKPSGGAAAEAGTPARPAKASRARKPKPPAPPSPRRK